MPEQMFVIDGDSLVKLLTAYFDGDVPLDAKLQSVGVSEYLQNYVGFNIASNQWPAEAALGSDGFHPLILRYEGKQNLSWSKAAGHEPVWGKEGQAFEVPK